MYGKKIKKRRIQLKMSQEELGKKVDSSASRIDSIEMGNCELSFSELRDFARVLGVSVDYLKMEDDEEVEEIVKETTNETITKQVIALCARCNKPIYNQNDIVRRHHGIGGSEIYCKSCIGEMNENKHQDNVINAQKRRIKSFVFSIIAFLFILISGIVSAEGDSSIIVISVVTAIMAFTLISCLILANNFIGDMVSEIFSWGFIKLPGIIFELSIDGLIWLICVKLLFWILGFILALLSGAFALVVGGIVSVFVYPFAIYNNFKHVDIREDK